MSKQGKHFTSRQYPLVYVRFWDHTSGSADSAEPMIIECFGILKSTTALCHIVCPWIASYNLSDPNSDAYCILKSTVVEYREIEVKEPRYESKDEKEHNRSSKEIKTGDKVGIRDEQ